VIATAGHADDDRLGVEHLRQRRDRGEHPPDERVDDLHGRDVDHDPGGAGVDDALGQVFLQRHHRLVLQVDLDRDEQDVAEGQDRDAVHQPAFVRRRRTTSTPLFRKA